MIYLNVIELNPFKCYCKKDEKNTYYFSSKKHIIIPVFLMRIIKLLLANLEWLMLCCIASFWRLILFLTHKLYKRSECSTIMSLLLIHLYELDVTQVSYDIVFATFPFLSLLLFFLPFYLFFEGFNQILCDSQDKSTWVPLNLVRTISWWYWLVDEITQNDKKVFQVFKNQNTLLKY